MSATLTDKDVRYAATRLGCSVGTIYRLVESKQLPFVNVGASDTRPTLRFLDEDLDAFIANRRVAANEPASRIPNPRSQPLTAMAGGRYR